MSEEKKPKAGAQEESVPLSKLPASVRKLLDVTPTKEWYKIKALRAKFEESVELTRLVPVLDHILEIAPGRCVMRMRQSAITPQEIDDAFRKIRDAINGLKDACRHVASLGQMEIRAWKGEAPAGTSGSPPGPPPTKEAA